MTRLGAELCGGGLPEERLAAGLGRAFFSVLLKGSFDETLLCWRNSWRGAGLGTVLLRREQLGDSWKGWGWKGPQRWHGQGHLYTRLLVSVLALCLLWSWKLFVCSPSCNPCGLTSPECTQAGCRGLCAHPAALHRVPEGRNLGVWQRLRHLRQQRAFLFLSRFSYSQKEVVHFIKVQPYVYPA